MARIRAEVHETSRGPHQVRVIGRRNNLILDGRTNHPTVESAKLEIMEFTKVRPADISVVKYVRPKRVKPKEKKYGFSSPVMEKAGFKPPTDKDELTPAQKAAITRAKNAELAREQKARDLTAQNAEFRRRSKAAKKAAKTRAKNKAAAKK